MGYPVLLFFIMFLMVVVTGLIGSIVENLVRKKTRFRYTQDAQQYIDSNK